MNAVFSHLGKALLAVILVLGLAPAMAWADNAAGTSSQAPDALQPLVDGEPEDSDQLTESQDAIADTSIGEVEFGGADYLGYYDPFGHTYKYTGAPIGLDLTVENEIGQTLEIGDHYVLTICDLDGHPFFDEMPSEEGRYYALVTSGDEDGNSFEVAPFVIISEDAFDLGNYDAFEISNVSQGGSETDLNVELYWGEQFILAQDIDFGYVGYKTEANGKLIGGFPAECGSYLAVFEGYEPFYGTFSSGFEIVPKEGSSPGKPALESEGADSAVAEETKSKGESKTESGASAKFAKTADPTAHVAFAFGSIAVIAATGVVMSRKLRA